MQALYLLILLSIGIGIVFVAIRLFSGMSGSGQFDDMVGPRLRTLQDRDDQLPVEPGKAEVSTVIPPAAPD